MMSKDNMEGQQLRQEGKPEVGTTTKVGAAVEGDMIMHPGPHDVSC